MKRSVDVIVSLFLLILFAPILCLVALLVRIFLGSPVIFYQTRPGMNGKLFRIYKFRTMLSSKDLEDKYRMTRFGSMLRDSSCDELPGLWNVLKGDMSLVGPRPLLPEYLPLYSDEQARRHEVRPGITGLAQVNGRNAISWEQKFEYDVQYVDNQSLFLDIKILFLTVKKVCHAEGISQEGQATVTPCQGSDGLR